MPPDFQSLLDKPADTYEPPKALTAGSYIFGVKSFKFDKSAQKKTDFVQFLCVPIQPLEDVPMDELALVDKWQEKEMKLDFYLTPDAMHRLGTFLVDTMEVQKGVPTREQIQMAVGGQFMGMVAHQPSNRDPSVVYANIVQTSPAPK